MGDLIPEGETTMGVVSWLVILPFLTALLVVLTPARRAGWIRWIALAGTGAHLLLTAVVTYLFWQQAGPVAGAQQTAVFTQLHLVERVPWFDLLGIQYFVGLDGISLLSRIKDRISR